MIKKFFIWLKETFGDTWLIKFIEKGLFSLDNSNKGLSGKKLTAFAMTFCVVQLHEYYGQYAFIHKDFSLLPLVLSADFGFLALLFGINEYSKNKASKNSETQEETITQATA
jgi:hypothetical protein